MALDSSYRKETHWIHKEVGTILEPPGGLKMWPSHEDWKRTVQEEDMEVGKERG
jgi:hypothetical protein